MTTSGGSPNEVVKTVNAVSPGDFVLHYSLTVSCPCAGVGTDVAGPTIVMDPPEGMSYASTTTPRPPGGSRDPGRIHALETRLR